MTELTDALPGFQFHRLTQIPRPVQRGGQDAPDDTATGLLAALTGSHASLLAAGDGGAVMTAWIRPAGDRELSFVVGGRPYFPPAASEPSRAGGGSRRVLFPPGALAEDLRGQDMARLLDAFEFWVPCAGNPDALWAADDPAAALPVRRGSFDRCAAHFCEPFAWLVLARPLLPAAVQPELGALVNEILPLARGEVSESKRVSLERKQARHRELARSQAGGSWEVRVLVGGTTSGVASTAAAMLCAASELHGLPYVLVPAGSPRALRSALAGNSPGAAFTASIRLVVALTRPPDRELPGLRLVQPHTFDVTPERDGASGLFLGAVLDEARADVGDLTLTLGALNRHAFVCGATGTGKSQTVRHLLEQATRAGLPWLVIEPAKAEYVRMASRIAGLGAEVIVIRPGQPGQPPAGINPLEPARGFPLQTHADLLRALFLASFEAQEPFPQILAAALTRCYEEAGWDLVLGEPARRPGERDGRCPPAEEPGASSYPGLADLQRVAEAVVSEIGYGKEIADNVRGFIKVRLASLRLGTTGRFFEGGHPIDFEQLCARNVILEIEDIGDDADKAFFMGVVLIRLAEHLRITSRTSPAVPTLRHLTVIEEAHRLLRRRDTGSGPAAHAVEMFAALLAEIRAYGEGLIIAEQIPAKIIPDVIKNTAVKIMHRLPADDDRCAVGATMNLDDQQSECVITLPAGHAAVFADGMDRPMLIRVPDGSVRETPSDPAPPLGPEAIIGRRSAACGPDCRQQPCTLRELHGAVGLLAGQPSLVVWAELTVVAHLTGNRMPVLGEAGRQDIEAEVTQRALACALAQAIQHAVRTRAALLPPTTTPGALAAHVAAAISRALSGHRHDCAAMAWTYVGLAHRWEIVRQVFATSPAVNLDRPHPETAEWQRRYGRRIAGRTIGQQLTSLGEWSAADLRDLARRDAVNFGAARPSALESAVGAPATTPEWGRRLRGALRPFAQLDWPAQLLDPQPGPGTSEETG